MPLRRRPPEPSPRLRALLERAEVAATGSGPEDLLSTAGVELWQPERAWIASPPRPTDGPSQRRAADRSATDATGRLRVRDRAPHRDRDRAPHRDRDRAPHRDRDRAPHRDGVRSAADPGVGVLPGRHRRPRPPGPAWLAVPEALRGARLTAPRAAAAGLLLVVLVATLVFGARVAMARAASEPRPVAPGPSQSAVLTRGPSTFATSATSAGGGGPPTAPGTVTVHVVGQVAHPGVVRLPAGSRVADAVARAGGAIKGADLGAVNLARVLADGEQVRVPKPGEAVAQPGGAPVGGSAPGGAGAGSGAAATAGLVDLNTATSSQLEDLPGVGPVLAQRIVDWRTEHGRFTTVDELNEVSGIGEKIFAQLKPKVTV